MGDYLWSSLAFDSIKWIKFECISKNRKKNFPAGKLAQPAKYNIKKALSENETYEQVARGRRKHV